MIAVAILYTFIEARRAAYSPNSIQLNENPTNQKEFVMDAIRLFARAAALICLLGLAAILTGPNGDKLAPWLFAGFVLWLAWPYIKWLATLFLEGLVIGAGVRASGVVGKLTRRSRTGMRIQRMRAQRYRPPPPGYEPNEAYQNPSLGSRNQADSFNDDFPSNLPEGRE
jgi:hypothetical protein